MLNILFSVVFCDCPEPWQLGFQDAASPSFEGIVELHDYIMFYLLIILQGVGMILTSATTSVRYFTNAIPYNHGTILE
jgi:cytochrome c oxidase subunit 2